MRALLLAAVLSVANGGATGSTAHCAAPDPWCFGTGCETNNCCCVFNTAGRRTCPNDESPCQLAHYRNCAKGGNYDDCPVTPEPGSRAAPSAAPSPPATPTTCSFTTLKCKQKPCNKNIGKANTICKKAKGNCNGCSFCVTITGCGGTLDANAVATTSADDEEDEEAEEDDDEEALTAGQIRAQQESKEDEEAEEDDDDEALTAGQIRAQEESKKLGDDDHVFPKPFEAPKSLDVQLQALKKKLDAHTAR